MRSKENIRLAILECDTPMTQTREQFGGYGGVFKALLRAAAAAAPDSAGRGPRFVIKDVSIMHDVPGDKQVLVVDKGVGEEEGERLKGKEEEEAGEVITIQVSSWNIERNPNLYPDPSDIDAVLLTGSRHSAYSADEWITRLVQYIRTIIELEDKHVSIIGVCFGHQIVGRALGAEVRRNDDGWEVAVLPVTLTDFGQSLFFGEDRGEKVTRREKLNIHQMHRDIVTTVPSAPEGSSSRVELLGATERCHVQGFYVAPPSCTTAPSIKPTPGKKNLDAQLPGMITLQGHPEFTAPIVREIVQTRHEQGVFNDDVYEDALRRVGKGHDGVVVAAAFLRFLALAAVASASATAAADA